MDDDDDDYSREVCLNLVFVKLFYLFLVGIQLAMANENVFGIAIEWCKNGVR